MSVWFEKLVMISKIFICWILYWPLALVKPVIQKPQNHQIWDPEHEYENEIVDVPFTTYFDKYIRLIYFMKRISFFKFSLKTRSRYQGINVLHKIILINKENF